jgi:hypothetical protein
VRVEIVREQAAGRAVLLLGDMNDRKPGAFCGITAGGRTTAANGGSKQR